MPASVLMRSDEPTVATERADDADLLRRIQRRDQTAVAELYDRAGGQAYGLAFSIVKDQGVAEDAVQDAFLTLWRQAPSLDAARGRVTSLLMTMVHRRAIDCVRRRGQVARSIEFEEIDVVNHEPQTIDLVTSAETRGSVRRAMAALPDDQRRTVQLAYFEGRTHVEIATMMGVPGGTVKSRLRLALEKMRVGLGMEFAC